MPVPFPHHYSASLRRTFASRARMEVPHRPVLYGGPSPELDGDLNAWSPEHLLLSSLGLCMLTTFEAFAARDGISILAWDARTSGTVEPTPDGLMFTSIVLELDIEIAGNVERIDATLEDAKQYCMVLNSLRVPVVVEAQVKNANDITETARLERPQAYASQACSYG